MLKTNQLSFSYKGSCGLDPVFKDLNLNLKPGFNTIIGPNGAGKSTLLLSMFGMLNYKGHILYSGRNLKEIVSDEKHRMMSYLPQMDFNTSMLSVTEMVLLGRISELKGKAKLEDLQAVFRVLNLLNIEHLAERMFHELSGGQQKIVFIAQTLVREPRLILLDEPINSLDLQKQLELCFVLKEIAATGEVDIITVLHDVNLAARYSSHIVVIDRDGKHYSSGSPNEVINKKMLEEVYGVIASVNYDIEGVPIISPLYSIRNKK